METLKPLRTINQMIHFCCLSNQEQLFEEMSNCLETEVNEDNYYDHVEKFEKSYRSWIDACKGDY